jgi:hypothetical protein
MVDLTLLHTCKMVTSGSVGASTCKSNSGGQQTSCPALKGLLHNFKVYFHFVFISHGHTPDYLKANFLCFKIFSALVFKYFSSKETNGDFSIIQQRV